MVMRNPNLTPSWQAMWRALGSQTTLPAEFLDQRWHDLQRHVREDEVTYNVYAGRNQVQREWDLDLLPVLLDHGEWRHLSHGIVQRVRVLNALLTDLYGERRLLKSGLLPPALVQGHPDYLQCMYRVPPPKGTYLHLAAFDLVRDPSGQWNVLSQRLQAPSGMGYLLENRQAVLHQLPHAFDALRIRRLGSTYRALLDGLRAHCPEGQAARIALLTPGQYNETYFEHAYLARYLGITLVEGADLTVRDQRLFLKTLHGLSPVHALIKRMDDQFLDPLELRPDSQLGVPGLIQTLRAGNLLLANWPGTGFMESSALLGFLPALAEHLLGERLTLPAAPTWWCGEAAVRGEALSMLDDCVIKPTYPSPYPGTAAREHFDPVLTRWLTPEARAQWAARIAAHGDDYTVQAHLPASQQPVWQYAPMGSSLSARPVVVRMFAVSTGPGQWRVLPGGMARLPQDPQSLSSMRLGGSSADVWVLGPSTSKQPDAVEMPDSPFAGLDSPVHETPIAPDMPPARDQTQLDVARRVRIVTSRAAENLFWLGRYTERAENLARLAMLTLETISGEEQVSVPLMAWLDLSCRKLDLVPANCCALADNHEAFSQALVAQLAPGSNGQSVGNILVSLRSAASGVRHRMALDHWRAISTAERDFSHAFKAQANGGAENLDSATRALTQLRERMAAIVGAQMDHMTRDDGWRMLTLGRYTERLNFFSQVLSQAFYSNAAHDFDGYEAILALFDSTISFHALYQQHQNLASLLDLLVISRENPRSLGFITQAVRGVLDELRRNAPEGSPDFAALIPQTTNATLSLLCTPDEVGNFHHLQSLLETCRDSADGLSNQISQLHFTHYHEARQSVWS